ncbi:MAG: hypothetical protein N2645_03985 [Clostridia bacterium]|nr:hypothetical protein [Clostridia bacterium]
MANRQIVEMDETKIEMLYNHYWDRIKNEDNLISQRLSYCYLGNTFLFSGLIASFAVASSQDNNLFLYFKLVVAFVGLIFSLICALLYYSSINAISLWRHHFNSLEQRLYTQKTVPNEEAFNNFQEENANNLRRPASVNLEGYLTKNVWKKYFHGKGILKYINCVNYICIFLFASLWIMSFIYLIDVKIGAIFFVSISVFLVLLSTIIALRLNTLNDNVMDSFDLPDETGEGSSSNTLNRNAGQSNFEDISGSF